MAYHPPTLLAYRHRVVPPTLRMPQIRQHLVCIDFSLLRLNNHQYLDIVDSILVCVPRYADGVTNFHLESCSKTLSKMVVGQTLGLAVINSFLLVLSLLTIPMLKNLDASSHRYQKPYRPESLHNPQLPHEYEGTAVIDKNRHISVTNHNTDYSVYQ